MGRVKERQIEIWESLVSKGYADRFSNMLDHEAMADDRVWLPELNDPILYDNITDDHLLNIFKLLHQGKAKSRQCHYKGIVEELTKRFGYNWKVLYGT